jgi:MOSC domain-containing protein YiiM
MAQVASVNVGRPRTISWHGREVTTAIWKAPVKGRLPVRGVNVAGDQQADRSVHGGPQMSLYAYGLDDYRWWEATLGRPVGPGTFGDNLTVAGLDPSAALIGERWAVGSAVLQVTAPRIPCYKLGIRMDDESFPRRFSAAMRPGAYLAIVQEGEIAAGDPLEVVHRPDHQVAVRTVARAYHGERELVPGLLEAPELPTSWRHWAEEHLPTAVVARRAGRAG